MENVATVSRLHAAVWEGNADRVRSLLQEVASEDNQPEDGDVNLSKRRRNARLRATLEAKDTHGNTPLHLATRLVQPAQRAIVQALLENGASVTSRSADGWSCLHDATLCDDEFLLAQLFLQGERQLWREVDEYQDDFLAALERLPDFEVEIFVEAYSWIPGVSSMLPSQTHRLLKRGSQLRVDSSMKGLERFNLNHGNISHVFAGRAGGSKAFILNHDTKRYYDITSAVNATSSLSKVDLGIHMLLTKELSTTSVDSSKLEFIKRKDVQEVKTKQKNGAAKRNSCPWMGTKYEMKNFAASFSFRNPANPRREHRQFAESDIQKAEQALGVVQGYVKEIHASAGKKRNSNPRSMMDTSLANEEEDNQQHESKKPAAPGSDQELWLPKGQNMEMHLEVRAGDVVAWEFSCNHKDYAFVATSYQDDVAQPVARCTAAKNATIEGSFDVEQDGNFVLKWLNTQKGFTLDKKGIKIVYKVIHTRPSAVAPPSNQATETTISDPAGQSTAPPSSDLEVCQQFQRPDHIPNPLTVVMSLNEYFSSEPVATETKKADESKTLTSLFKRNTKPSTKSDTATAEPSPSMKLVDEDGKECRNTFRSLTIQPMPKRYHKNFEAKVFMAQDFPIQMTDFLPVIEFLSKTGDQVKNLSEFFRMKLPPGFPVRFELPMMFTVRAAYTFQKAIIRDDIEPSLFDLPDGYTQVTAVKDILPQQS